MDVGDDPVAVMRERVYRADGKQRPFEGGHAVEGHAGDEELEHGIGAQLYPTRRAA